ncbi:MAG: cell division protein FtsQ/DivIB [Brevinema sp.]
MLNQKLSAPLILLLIAISFGLHRAVYEFMNTISQSFEIKKIDIKGTVLSRDMQFEQIITQSTNEALGNLNNIDLQTLKYNLEQLELIKKADIQKDLPYTLTIIITERQPIATLKTAQLNYTVDKEGYILSLIPNIAIPELRVEFGVAINNRQIADDFLIQILSSLGSIAAKNIQYLRIDKNRESYFQLYNISPQFYIEKMILNDDYIATAQKIGQTLTNPSLKIPKIIDIYSYKDTSIGFY